MSKLLNFLKILLFGVLIYLFLFSYRYDLLYNETDNIAAIALPIAILIYFFVKYLNIDFSCLKIKEFIIKYIFVLLFSLFWVKTFKRFVLPIEMGINFKNLFKMTADIIQASAIILVFIELAKKISIPIVQQKPRFYDIILFSLPSLAIMIIVWLAVFPGLMVSDSTIIWTMVEGLEPYTNIHPITYTMLLKLGSFLWNTPASAILFQIIITAFAIGFTGWTFKSIGVNYKIAWAAIIIMSALPLTWLYAVTMLKDSLFTMGMIILIDIVVLAIRNPQKILSSVKWYIYFGLTALFIMITRHNGVVPVIGILFTGIIISIIKKNKKFALKAAITTVSIFSAFIVLIFAITLSLGDKYEKQEASPLLFTQPIHHVMAVYGKHKHEMDSKTLAEIDFFLDLEYVDKYLNGWESLGFEKGYYFQNLHRTGDWEAINANKKEFFNLWFRLIREYPYTAYLSANRLNSIVWYSKDYGFTTRYVYGIFQDEDFAVIPADYKLPQINEKLKNVLTYFDNIWLLWRPAWAMLISLILGYVAIAKKKYINLIILIPMLLNNLGLLIAVPFPDTRFVYYNFYVLIIFAIIVFHSNKAPDETQALGIKT